MRSRRTRCHNTRDLMLRSRRLRKRRNGNNNDNSNNNGKTNLITEYILLLTAAAISHAQSAAVNDSRRPARVTRHGGGACEWPIITMIITTIVNEIVVLRQTSPLRPSHELVSNEYKCRSFHFFFFKCHLDVKRVPLLTVTYSSPGSSGGKAAFSQSHGPKVGVARAEWFVYLRTFM